MGSIALYLEADGDGARLCEALARCAERGVGVAVLKVGASAAGAVAAAAHTGAVAGDQRVFRALVEEAGAAWAADVHELLELAKALAVPGARPAARRRASPCSPARAATPRSRPTSASASGWRCRRSRRATGARLRELLPDAATVGNPLDYTALIWGEVEHAARHRDRRGRAIPAIDQVLVLYDQPGRDRRRARRELERGARGHPRRRRRQPGAGGGRLHAARAARRRRRGRFADGGHPGGRRPAHRARRAWRRCGSRPGDPARLREIGAAAAALQPSPGTDGWLAEHEAKQLLRAAGLPVVEGRLVAGEDDAVAALGELGGPGGAQAVRAGAAPQERARRRSRSTCAARTTCAPPTGGSWRSGSRARRCSSSA